jgi:hypothetical protein
MNNLIRLVVSLSALISVSGCASMVRDRIYRPSSEHIDAAWLTAPPRPVVARTADGLDIHGLYWAPEGEAKDILVFFHGNGGDVERAAHIAEPLRRPGSGLLIASYRGYPGNPGRPSEAGLFADGQAFLALARQLQPGSRTYVFGWSLGGAVALEMAARNRVDGVATLGAFSRLADAAPPITRGFLPDHFDNLAAIGRVTAPVFLFHGTGDQVIPYAHAGRLRQASHDRATVVTLTGAGHQVDFAKLAPIVWRALDGAGPPS